MSDESAPHNLEAERAVLGTCMINTAAIDVAAAVIDAADCWRDAHARIWRAIVTVQSQGAAVDLVTVRDAGPPAAFVLTQAKARARITGQTLAALGAHGDVLPAVIHDRVDFAAAMTDGGTAIELRPNGPAAAEAIKLWEFAKRRIRELATTPRWTHAKETADR